MAKGDQQERRQEQAAREREAAEARLRTAEMWKDAEAHFARLVRDGKVIMYVLPGAGEPGGMHRLTFAELHDYCVAQFETAEALCKVDPQSRIYQHQRACYYQLSRIIEACGSSAIIRAEMKAISDRHAAAEVNQAAAEAAPAAEAAEGETAE